MQDHIAGESVTLDAAGSSSTIVVLDVRQHVALEPPASFFGELRAKLPSIKRLEIVGDTRLTSKSVHHILQLFRESASGSRPLLLLPTHTFGGPDEARRILAGIPGVTV